MEISILNNFKTTKELELLLFCIQSNEAENANKHFGTMLKDIDWAFFEELVTHHRVGPSVFKTVKNATVSSYPQDVFKGLKEQYRQTSLQMLKLTGEMLRVCQQLADENIQTLVLKGPVLGKELYGNFCMRPSKDLDLLIEVQNVYSAEEALYKLGYQKDKKDQEKDLKKVIPNSWKMRTHHFSYIHPVTHTNIELHWRLHPPPSKEPAFSELWVRRSETSISNIQVSSLGREDLFLFLVTHGARHGWFRLRWLGDIDRIARMPLDWKCIFALMKKYRYEHMVGQALILSNQLLNTPIPNEMNMVVLKRKSEKFANKALFFVRQIIKFNGENTSKEISEYHSRYIRSLKPYWYQIGKFVLDIYRSLVK